jgi:hypothetical protein
MATLKFNRKHANGWVSYRIAGLKGSVFIDGKMLTDETKANPPQTMELDYPFAAPGADASEAARLREEKKAARDAAKAERATKAAAKAQERLAKLQAAADRAAERARKAAGVNAPAGE